MKTITYRFNEKLFLQNEKVTINFNVALNNLEKFLKIALKYGAKVSKEKYTAFGSSKSFTAKRVTVTNIAVNVYEMMIELGWNERSEVWDNINVCYRRFECLKHNRGLTPLNYIVYSPKKRISKQIQSTPIVINGRMIVSNGKLYRRFN